jgi:hypothetical protein
MLQDFEKKGREKGIPIDTVPLKNTGPKINRIQSFQPFTKSGALQFFHGHRLLLDQCRDFPMGKYDDGLDALEMAVRVAGIGFSGKYDYPEVFMAANDIPSPKKGRSRVTGILDPRTGEGIYEDWMDWVCPRHKKR